MRFFKITLAVAVFLGLALADACAPDGSCPAGYHCNEFKRCIAGAPAKADGIHCTSNTDCASDHHCNEFHFCIPGAPRSNPVPNGACNPDGSCPAG
jgi:hypothetical protein